jgi:D-3-phosphoglycerate dehydrogenase
VSQIFSTHALHPDAEAMLTRAGTLTIASAPTPAAILAEGLDAEVLIVRAAIPPAFFTAAKNLRAAIRHGAGLDMIPYDAATAAGVLIANVPGANAQTVAEHVIMTSLMLLRRFRVVDGDLRKTGWEAGRAHANSGRDLSGKTLGIIGMGHVGHEIFRIAHHGFGLQVLANSRNPDSLPEAALFAPVDQLVEQADIVVLCCPLTPQTTGLMSAARIARMKKDAILINVSRGPVVDEAGLIAALARGAIGGAALDVFSSQPLPPDHAFFGFDNVILTPHIAGITEESMMRMGRGAAAEAIRVLDGGLPVNLRNPEVVEQYRRRFAQ